MNGVNPAEYLELYLSHLREDNPYFFQHPKRESKKFNIHDCDIKIYYENAKIRETYVGNMLPELCEAIGIPRVTNFQVRPTTASKLKAKHFEDCTIMSLRP